MARSRSLPHSSKSLIRPGEAGEAVTGLSEGHSAGSAVWNATNHAVRDTMGDQISREHAARDMLQRSARASSTSAAVFACRTAAQPRCNSLRRTLPCTALRSRPARLRLCRTAWRARARSSRASRSARPAAARTWQRKRNVRRAAHNRPYAMQHARTTQHAPSVR